MDQPAVPPGRNRSNASPLLFFIILGIIVFGLVIFLILRPHPS
jgi:hypothetical protein